MQLSSVGDMYIREEKFKTNTNNLNKKLQA